MRIHQLGEVQELRECIPEQQDPEALDEDYHPLAQTDHLDLSCVLRQVEPPEKKSAKHIK